MIFQVELSIVLLVLAAIALLFWVSGKKAVQPLVSLVFTIAVLVWAIVPLIANGYNPVLVTLVLSLPILAISIYFAQGFTRLSHISIVITEIIFLLSSLLAGAAVWLAHFSGIVSDLASTAGGELGINLPELLTAGIMLGTLGILIEMVVTQVATVEEFILANPHEEKTAIFKKAFSVGKIHLGSIINTLFLIYAGVALPLLIVFGNSGGSFLEVFGYEPLSTEIVRTLVGVIALIAAMPLSTVLAVEWLKKKNLH
jgi:uncharacterized membrane protein